MQYYTRISLQYVPGFNCILSTFCLLPVKRETLYPTLSIHEPLPHQMEITKNIFKVV